MDDIRDDSSCQAPRGHEGLPRTCPHCGDPRLRRWGFGTRGLPRLRCVACGRTCSAATGVLDGRIRRPAAFQMVRDDMLAERASSCRALARRLGVHRMTVWRWRMRLLSAVCRRLPAEARRAAGPVLMACRESRKASREWVNHARFPQAYPPPPRPRWGDLAPGETPPGGWVAWQIPVRVADGAEGPVLEAGARGACPAALGRVLRAGSWSSSHPSAARQAGTSRSIWPG